MNDVRTEHHSSVIGLGLPDPLTASKAIQASILYLSQELTPTETFAICGIKGSAIPFEKALTNNPLSKKLIVHYDSEHSQFDSFHINPFSLLNHRSKHSIKTAKNPDYIVIWTELEAYCKLTRFFISKVKTQAHLILPFLPAGTHPASHFENRKPILINLFPCAGSNRLSPAITALLSLTKRILKPEFPLTQNDRHNDNPSAQKSQQVIDDFYQAKIQALNYYEYLPIHDPISTKVLQEFKDIQSIYLIRDPRDILISYYFFSNGQDLENEVEKEKYLLYLIEGENRELLNYFLIWPSLKQMVSHFLEAQLLPQVYIVKFEELQQTPLSTYKKMLDWLMIRQTPLFNIPDSLIAQAIKLSSFNYQTEGRRERGKEDTPMIKNGITNACRKGIIGDWRNHFSANVIQAVKEQIGNELIELGYENDLNW